MNQTQSNPSDPEARANAARAQAKADMQAADPPPEQTPASQEGMPSGLKKAVYVILAAILIVVVGSVIAFLVAAGRPDGAALIGAVRDIFIIIMAWFSILIGVTLIVLIMQIASLMNLLKNEIIPILDSLKQTGHTVRGTSQFMSKNLAKPVIRFGGLMAYLRAILSYLGFIRRAELTEDFIKEPATTQQEEKPS